MNHGVKLETLSWTQAETWLAGDPVAVLPLGAAAKEHGPHLPLNNDAIIADWLAEQIRQRFPVVVTPLINASFFPAFVEYPGSISLTPETARDLVLQTCTSLARFGVTRFYVANTGLSTLGPLRAARDRLPDGLQFAFFDLESARKRLPADLLQQAWGTHADEHETSLMLHIAPEIVDLSLAVDDGREGEGMLSRTRGNGIWSASGVYGQATLASAAKGRIIADALRAQVLAEVEQLMAGDAA